MENDKIIDLFLGRSEHAIIEVQTKFGKLIYSLAYHILNNHLDSEECEIDTYMGAWDTIPPTIPDDLKAYLLRITRNLALKRYHYNHAAKRDCTLNVPLDELAYCLPDNGYENKTGRNDEMADLINSFLEKLKPECRKVFLLRYWYFASIKEIMLECNMSKSKVESMLFRTRNNLRKELVNKGGYGKLS